MAGTHTTSGTLVATTVATVSFTFGYSQVLVVNRGTTEIWATTDGSTPTVAGDDCDVVLPTSSRVFNNRLPQFDQAANLLSSAVGEAANPNPGTVVKLISSGTPTYSVAGL